MVRLMGLERLFFWSTSSFLLGYETYDLCKMASLIEVKATFLVIFEVRMNILFNIKVKISSSLNGDVGLPNFVDY